jgi:putative proteasome-type protease
MTYCVGTLTQSGLVFVSDSRTNAGVDHVATFSKMNVFEKEGERVLVLLSAGNLGVTQAVVSYLREDIRHDQRPHLFSVTSLFGAAQVVGQAIRKVWENDGRYLKEFSTDFVASFIFGGQIGGGPHGMFMIYNAGNFIEASPDTPFFQIGETKYGKPILDRVINYQSSLLECAKCVLISFDSTIRSNISVGLPLDILIYAKGRLEVGFYRKITHDDEYFRALGQSWSDGLRKVFKEIQNPDWLEKNIVDKNLLGSAL